MVEYKIYISDAPDNKIQIFVPDLGIQFNLTKLNNFRDQKREICIILRKHLEELKKYNLIIGISSDAIGDDEHNLSSDDTLTTTAKIDFTHPNTKLSRIFPILGYVAAATTNSLYGMFTIYSMRITAKSVNIHKDALALSLCTSINGLMLMMIVYHCSKAPERAKLIAHKLDKLIYNFFYPNQTIWHIHGPADSYNLPYNSENNLRELNSNEENINIAINKYPSQAVNVNPWYKRIKKFQILAAVLVLAAFIDAINVAINEYQTNKLLTDEAHEKNLLLFSYKISYILLIIDVICKPLTIFSIESSFAYSVAKPAWSNIGNFFSKIHTKICSDNQHRTENSTNDQSIDNTSLIAEEESNNPRLAKTMYGTTLN